MMMADNWTEANQEHLAACLAGLREFVLKTSAENAPPAWDLAQPPAIESLTQFFGLSAFERNLLLLCAGAEMDSGFPSLFHNAFADSARALPTFGFACASLSDAHWSALSPAGPLRRWRLIELMRDSGTLVNTPLRIAERVLHYLAGVNTMDERLQCMAKPVSSPPILAPSHIEVAKRIGAIWSRCGATADWPAIVLCGRSSEHHREIGAYACATLGMACHAIYCGDLPAGPHELDDFLRVWEREAVLSGTALLLDCSGYQDGIPTPAKIVIEQLRAPLLVSARSAVHCPARLAIALDAAPPKEAEQTALWHATLDPVLPCLNGTVEALASHFELSASAIAAASEQALTTGGTNEQEIAAHLWEACRRQSRPRLDSLAQRIESNLQWDDLVVRQLPKQTLRQIAIHVKQRSKVYHQWGFGSTGTRGLGITALFAGPSGVGKTMAAEVLANDLRLDLYRIDLSQVVSKYIGETEKNLSRIFDAAEEGSVVLLFDEADALFGKRSDVKDSHDRYANIEISYLLQRMEAYRGLAILTTNRKSALDQAFLRRIRFLVDFPYPEVPERLEIWKRTFPPATPLDSIRMDRLAHLNASGGNIRNIAMNAAFLAADAGEPVRMSHLLAATRAEFAKLERPLSDAEIAGWV